MKSILIFLPYGMSARNILRSKTYSTLREKARLVILSPLAEDPLFIKEFSHPNVSFYCVSRHRTLMLKIAMQIYYSIKTYAFTQRNPITTLIFLKNELKKNHLIRYLFILFVAKICGPFKWLTKKIEDFYFSCSINPHIEKIFSTEKISLVFLTHGFTQEDVEIILSAKKRGIPIVNLIHSWDNITSKSGMQMFTTPNVGKPLLVQFFDRILVWNKILKRELMEMYGFPEEKIFLTGIPQFDKCLDSKKYTPRKKFFDGFGGDPEKKLIYFMAASPVMIHDQSKSILKLINWIKENKFSHPTQLLIRLHPKSQMDNWIKKYEGPNIFVQKPGAAFSAVAVSQGWSSSDGNELIESIYHSDIIINTSSTTSIDAATQDKPIVCLGFDGDESNNKRLLKLYEFNHYNNVVKTGGIKIAKNETEFFEFISEYLENPSLDQEGRKKIVSEQCYRLDGKAGERVAGFVLDSL